MKLIRKKANLFFVLFLIGCFSPNIGYGQETLSLPDLEKNTWFYVESKLHYGYPIKYSDSLSETLQKPFSAEDIRIGIFSKGKHPSQISLGFPNYGFGFYHAQLSDKDTLGRPFALYSFYQAPIFQNKHIRFAWEIDFGLAWHFNIFDKVKNYKNDLISSDLNIIFNFNLNTAIRLSKRFDLSAAVGFTHFSNGTLKIPNKGLNMYGGSVGCVYNFANGKNKPFKRFNKDEFAHTITFNKHNEFDFFVGMGAKAIKTNERFLVGSAVAEFYRRYGWIGKYGVGLDFFYDGTLREDFNPNNLPSGFKYTMLGIHASHELVVSDFSLITQIGGYLWKNMDAKGKFFLRVGVRYNITKHLYANLSLKTVPKLRADYIEFGCGVRIFKP